MKHKLLGLLFLVTLITSSIIPSLIVLGAVEDSSFPPTLSFNATIRDFRDSHSDFQNPTFFNAANKVGFAPTEGLAANTLDLEKKPVFAGTPGHMITNKNTFSQWYRDIPSVNTSIAYELVLNHI